MTALTNLQWLAFFHFIFSKGIESFATHRGKKAPRCVNFPRTNFSHYLMYDEDSIEIPPFHPDENVTRTQVLHFGPHIPTSPWRSPQRPVGYFGEDGLAPDFKFVKRDRSVFQRLQRCKYQKVLYKGVRMQYKRYIRNSRSIGELLYWRMKLDALPKRSSPVRYKNACMITGRTRAYYRIVGLGRHKFRDFCSRGFVPGVRRASW